MKPDEPQYEIRPLRWEGSEFRRALAHETPGSWGIYQLVDQHWTWLADAGTRELATKILDTIAGPLAGAEARLSYIAPDPLVQAAELLNLPMQDNDAEAKTVREYLIRLLETVWVEAGSFSGKRPFGNSGWRLDLYQPLIKAGVIRGSFSSGGYLDDCDTNKAFELIRTAICSLLREEVEP